MRKLTFILIFLSCWQGSKIFAQDTLVFTQDNSVMFSNKYYLFPKTNTFEHHYSTDDGQTWYGKGDYRIKKGKLILDFGDSEEDTKKKNEIIKIYDKETDTLIINLDDQYYDPPIGSVQYLDKHFYPKWEMGKILIPKSTFNSGEIPVISIRIQREIVYIELPDIKRLNTINIYADDFYGNFHSESNFRRILNFKTDKLISKDYYYTSKKKNVVFSLLK